MMREAKRDQMWIKAMQQDMIRDPWFARPSHLGPGSKDVGISNGHANRFRRLQDELLYEVSREQPRMCIPTGDLRVRIMQEAHDAAWTAHPGQNNTLRTIRRNFWWSAMIKDVKRYVRTCVVCQKDKADRQRPLGLLQPQPQAVPKGRWKDLAMDLVESFPETDCKHNRVLVVVDRLTKRVRYIPIRTTASMLEIAELFLQHIVREHGLPKTIVSDRKPGSLNQFWRELFHALGTRLTPRRQDSRKPTDRPNARCSHSLRDYDTTGLRHYVSHNQHTRDR